MTDLVITFYIYMEINFISTNNVYEEDSDMDFVTPIYKQIELMTAEEAKAVADAAPFNLEQQSVAHAINNAANTGAHSITWSRELSDAMVELLKEKGYTVIQNSRAADPNTSWTITGF